MEAVARRSESPSVKSKSSGVSRDFDDSNSSYIDQVKSKRRSSLRCSKAKKSRTNGVKFDENGDSKIGENHRNGDRVESVSSNGDQSDTDAANEREVLNVKILHVNEVGDSEYIDVETKEADIIETPCDTEREVEIEIDMALGMGTGTKQQTFFEHGSEIIEVTEIPDDASILNDSGHSSKVEHFLQDDLNFIIVEEGGEVEEEEVVVEVEEPDPKKEVEEEEEEENDDDDDDDEVELVDESDIKDQRDEGEEEKEVKEEINVFAQSVESIKVDISIETEEKADTTVPSPSEESKESPADSSFTSKITGFLGKLSPLRQSQPKQEAETSSPKRKFSWLISSDETVSKDSNVSSSDLNRSLYARIAGRPSVKSATPQRELSSSREPVIGDVKTPVFGRFLNDSFRVKSEPPRKRPADDPILKRAQGKRCLNADEAEENEEGFFSRLSFRKRRKLDEPSSSQGFFGGVLRSPFRKRTIQDVQPETGTVGKFTWLLPPYWFRRNSQVEEKPEKESDTTEDSEIIAEELKTEEEVKVTEQKNCNLM